MIRTDGFALVLVLWVLSLLTIMAGSFALSMRRETVIAAGFSSDAKAVAVAESGLAIAELMLMSPDLRQRWLTDGSVYQIDYTGAKVRVQLLSETGKVDINSADQTLLQGLMAHAPVEAELQTKLVNAILDWRDADELVRIEGAEKKEYKAAGLSYRPLNKPFQSVEELQLVLGMNERVFNWLENRVTIYSGQAKVDLAKAAREVLLVLPDMDAGLIDSYLAARRESAMNGLPVSAFSLGAGTGGQSAAPANSSGIAANSGMEQAGAITVVSEARLDDGATAMIKVLINRSATGELPFQTLRWKRGIDIGASLFTYEKNQLLVRRYAEPEFNN